MRLTGIGSGMDIDSMVKQLMNAERIPLNKLTQKKTWTEWQRDAYRDVNVSLTNFRTAFEGLRFSKAFNTYSATASSNAIKAETTATTLPGTYTVNVSSLASTAKIHSDKGLTEGDGTSTKSTSKLGFDGQVEIKNSDGKKVIATVALTKDMTMSDVAKKIQDSTAGKDIPLVASFDSTTSRFFMSSKNMGADQNFQLDFSDTDLMNRVMGTAETVLTPVSTNSFTTAKAATYGSLTYEGIEINNLKENKTTVNGLVIQLQEADNQDVSITIQKDATQTFDAIKKAVDTYNEMIEKLEKQLVEPRYKDFAPLTDEQRRELSESEVKLWDEKAKSGLLRADSTTRGILNDLRRAFNDPVDGIPAGNVNTLSQIGISTGDFRQGGKLFIDEAKLKAALNDKPDEVLELFTKATGGTGVAERVYKEINDGIKVLSTKAGSTTSLTDNSDLTKRIKTMDQQISMWQSKLATIENRYFKEFSAMDRAMNQMFQQSSWLQQSLSGGM